MALTPVQFFGTVVASLLFLSVFFRVLRYVLLTSKIQGPSLWDLATVHAKKLLGDEMITYVTELSASYGFRPWGTWTFGGFALFVSDLDTISEIYRSKDMHDKPQMFYSGISSFIGEGLLTLNGEVYRQHRKISGPAFRKSALEAQLPLLHKDACTLVERVRKLATGKDVDIRILISDAVGAMTVIIITEGRLPTEDLVQFFPAVPAALDLIQMRSLNPFYYFLVHKWKKSTRQSQEYIYAAIENARQKFYDFTTFSLKRVREEGMDKKPDSITDVMVQECLRRGGEETPEIMKEGFAEILTLLTAGQDTTTFISNTALLMLALHSEIQEKAFQEIQSVFGDSERPVEVDDLNQLVYLECVVKETLRMFPAAPVIGRKADKEINLNGVTIPKGCTVFTNIMALHRNPEVYKDPLAYNPDRFLPEMSQGRSTYAFLTFSAGFRHCPGQMQAIMVIKTILCHILRNFEVLPGESLKSVKDIKFVMHFSLHLSGSSLRFVDRKTSD